MHHVHVDIPIRRFDRFPRRLLMVAGGAAIVGLVVWVLALIGAFGESERAWQAYLHAWLYFTSLTVGAIAFAAALVVTDARWARSVRRFALAPVAFLPLAWLLLIPILLKTTTLFPWAQHPEALVPPQDMWMEPSFVAARNLVLFGALVLLGLAFTFFALRPDAGLGRDLAPARGRGLYTWMTRGWRGQEVEEAHAWARLRRLAVIYGLLYAVALSFIAYDFVMSLENHFISTLIGPYFFMGAFLGGIALTGLITAAVRGTLRLHAWILPVHLHDIGKLTFAFCIFWAYLFWAQYIVIWYGLLLPEQAFLVHRMSEPFGVLSMLVLLGIFVVPFAGLLGVAPKKKPFVYSIFASIILFAIWLERYILVYPSLYIGAEDIPLGLPEIGATLLFGGLFLATIGWFLSTMPVMQSWEAPSEPHPDLLLDDARNQAPMRQITAD
ncbi:MAG TPA: hypothetical protein VMN78_00885 [Longimicrobiales bacterium]|nr:hypothetical protein [Longimicrobiales bacterium]